MTIRAFFESLEPRSISCCRLEAGLNYKLKAWSNTSWSKIFLICFLY